MNKKYLLLLLYVFLLFSITIAKDYSDEFKNAYKYAYEKWITTTSSIDKANMCWSITRIELAKMVSEFSINVLWLQPNEKINCNFYDIPPDLDKQYNYWVTKVCQLWLMWIYDDWEKADYFNPRKNVTRGQWATILSRAINQAKWRKKITNWDPFYKPHLKYLIANWIIDSYDGPSPNSIEKRWEVMSMMYKADPENMVVVNHSQWYTKLKPNQSYYNKYYGFRIEHYNGDYPYFVTVWSGDYWLFVNVHQVIPEKFWDYEISHDYNDIFINEYKKEAESFNESWLVLFVESRSMTKKWYEDYQSAIEWIEDQYMLPIPTSKWYIIYQEPGAYVQDSPYEYVGKEKNNLDEYVYVLWEIIWQYILKEQTTVCGKNCNKNCTNN